MSEQQTSRRSFIMTSIAGAIGATWMVPGAARAGLPRRREDALKLGVASYSLREFPRGEAIEMIQALRTPYVNIKSFHLPYELTAAELVAGRAEFEQAGLEVVGGGTITFDEDTDEGVKRYFDYARGAGMPLMVATSAPTVLPRIERFAKEYDIRVAIHNHGPEDRHYPSPYDALRHIEDMDSRMGLCVDIGHTVRAGTDVVQALRDAGPRVLDLHVKDLSDLRDARSQVIVGQGGIPVADIFAQLLEMRYPHAVNLEYEIDARDPLPGMKQSFAYMRGVLAGRG